MNSNSTHPLLLDAKATGALLGISMRQVWRLADRGMLPAPVKLSGKCTRWRYADLVEWCHARCPDWARGTELRDGGRTCTR